LNSTNQRFYRIENYSILIATCAPVIRLFLRTFVDQRRESRGHYFRSSSHSSHNAGEKNSGRRTGVTATATANEDSPSKIGSDSVSSQSADRTVKAQPDPEVASGRVTVKTDIFVRVNKGSTSDGGPGVGSSGRREERFGYLC